MANSVAVMISIFLAASVAYWFGYVMGHRQGHLEALVWLKNYIDNREFMKAENQDEVHRVN